MGSTMLCIVLQIIIWTVPNRVVNAVLYSFIGLFLGPMYPVVMMAILDIMPADLQPGTTGWCSSVGQAGSAIMPLYVAGKAIR